MLAAITISICQALHKALELCGSERHGLFSVSDYILNRGSRRKSCGLIEATMEVGTGADRGQRRRLSSDRGLEEREQIPEIASKRRWVLRDGYKLGRRQVFLEENIAWVKARRQERSQLMVGPVEPALPSKIYTHTYSNSWGPEQF